MAPTDQYPDQRRARRVLELSCPDSDEEMRENLAFLVSKRRITIDAALEKLGFTEEEEDSSSSGQESKPQRGKTTPPAAPRQTTTSSARTTSPASAAPRAPNGGSSNGKAPARVVDRRVSVVSVSDSDEDGETDRTYRRGGGGRSRGANSAAAREQEEITTLPTPVPTPAPTGRPTFSRAAATAPANAAAPSKPAGTSAATARNTGGSYRHGRYIRNNTSNSNRVSQSDSELTDLREASISLVQHEDDDGVVHSAPDIVGSCDTPRHGVPPPGAKGRSAATTTPVGAAQTSKHEATPPVRSSKTGAWADEAKTDLTPFRSADEPPTTTVKRASNSSVEAHGLDMGDGTIEPIFTDLKMVTPEEKTWFEDKQKDKMHYWYGDETSMYDYTLKQLGPGQVLFFMASMTGDRAVRDNCRHMENLLHLKLIPHHVIDVADSEYFLRRVRKMYGNATGKRVMPSMPLLFVDDKLIGDFTTLQDLEDAGELDAKLMEAGCTLLRPRVVAACGLKHAGLPEPRLNLPTKAAAKKTSSTTSPLASSANGTANGAVASSTASTVTARHPAPPSSTAAPPLSPKKRTSTTVGMPKGQLTTGLEDYPVLAPKKHEVSTNSGTISTARLLPPTPPMPSRTTCSPPPPSATKTSNSSPPAAAPTYHFANGRRIERSTRDHLASSTDTHDDTNEDPTDSSVPPPRPSRVAPRSPNASTLESRRPTNDSPAVPRLPLLSPKGVEGSARGNGAANRVPAPSNGARRLSAAARAPPMVSR